MTKYDIYKQFYAENAAFDENKRELLASHVLQGRRSHVTQSSQHAAFQSHALDKIERPAAADIKDRVFKSSLSLASASSSLPSRKDTETGSQYKPQDVRESSMEAANELRKRVFESNDAKVFRGQFRELQSTTKSDYQYRGMDPSAKAFTSNDFQISHISFGRDRTFHTESQSHYKPHESYARPKSTMDRQDLLKSNIPFAHRAGQNHSGEQQQSSSGQRSMQSTMHSSFTGHDARSQRAATAMARASRNETLHSSVHVCRGRSDMQSLSRMTFQDPMDVYAKQRGLSP